MRPTARTWVSASTWASRGLHAAKVATAGPPGPARRRDLTEPGSDTDDHQHDAGRLPAHDDRDPRSTGPRSIPTARSSPGPAAARAGRPSPEIADEREPLRRGPRPSSVSRSATRSARSAGTRPGARRGLLRHPGHGRGGAHPEHPAQGRAARADHRARRRPDDHRRREPDPATGRRSPPQLQERRGLHRGRRRRRVRPCRTRHRPPLRRADRGPRNPRSSGRTLDEKSAAAMCYTSGTTGDPKGVVYSHRSTYLHALGHPGHAGHRVRRVRPHPDLRPDVPRQRLGHPARRLHVRLHAAPAGAGS